MMNQYCLSCGKINDNPRFRFCSKCEKDERARSRLKEIGVKDARPSKPASA
ncbi:hypothetical protein HOT76_gp07 [Eggerthella phage PMBT5]|uniref:Uncharacterized protein n=1 Tax=Eggerthella phage PMBT5 TaxID=2283015 RepID=A0A345MKC1_9CAUD|nr:hypothetical protein HOT76_gp07 [Eggerthella phage PMBT5]AXH71784.1 hypothetical protein HOT76_gp07 [Eggerthella phage PMBT5]